MAKKVLALNFGRPKGNCKMFLQEACDAAAAAGGEVEIVDCMKLKIHPCIGCGSCSRKLQSGEGQISCCIKDDFDPLAWKVLAADAIIVAAPVYVLEPCGNLKNFVDRFGPAHDKAYMLFENELRKDNGQEELHPDNFKRHVVSYISVGGAMTPNWVSYGLPGINLFGMSLNMKVVDQIDAYGAYYPPRTKMLMEQCKRLGTRIVEAVDLKNDEITWESEEGVCPVCHCKEVTIYDGSTKVCCPVCGIFGDLTIEGGKIKVNFSEAEQRRSRMKFSGVLEHQVEQGRKDRYPRFDEYVEKFSAMQDDM